VAETAPHKSAASPRATVNSTGELRQLGAGKKLGRYTLLRRVAAGGMAEVYAARSHGVSGFEKKVAIKKILPQYSLNARFVDMLVDEAKIAVSLTHPNIAQIYELGLEDDTYYIVMEFVDGRPLNRLLQKVDARGHRTIPIEHAVHIVAEVSKGLYHAHEQRDHRGQPLGIVHRDVSPQNVMIAHTGDVKLIDFGIARAEGRAAQTNVGTIKGKLRYLAPEIALGLEPDHRVDVYCCGIVLFELLTGEAMFAPRTDVEAIEMASQAKVRSPRLSNPAVPVELEDIVMRALVRDRDRRYPSARALHVDLRRFLNTFAPAFVGSELGDYMLALFGPEMEEDRRLDQLAEKVVAEVQAGGAEPARAEPAPVARPREPSALGLATDTRSGGYRELVTRSSIDLVAPVVDETPALGTDQAAAGRGGAGGEDTAAIATARTRPLVDVAATRATLVDTGEGRALVTDGAGKTDAGETASSRPAPTADGASTRGRLPVLLAAAAVLGVGAWWVASAGSRPDAPAAGEAEASVRIAPVAPISPLPSPVPPEERGRLMVEVAPTVAVDVSVDDQLYIERAMPPVRVEVPVRDAPQVITISAPGYHPSTQTRRLARGNEILVTASLDPIQTTVRLVGLEPGARVSSDVGVVDGELIRDVDFGRTVTVRVQRAGMREQLAKVTVDDPGGVTLDIPRGQALVRGVLKVASRPSSDVFVNDRNVGRTPYEGSFPAGTYRVVLKRGSTVHKRTVTVPANNVIDVTHQW
jgi:tRNA A-37 threonylcarbamoyl transferase component Bud32